MTMIQILGTGCPKCKELANHADTAAKELGIDYELVKITNINDITNFGVIMTPAMAIDNDVKFAGRVPSIKELKEILLNNK